MLEFMLYLHVLVALLMAGVAGWLLSLKLNNVAIVDSLWGLFIATGGLLYFYPFTAPSLLETIAMALLAVWALRLSGYITWRNWGKPEDHRYQTIRKNNQPYFAFKSLYIIFGLQALLASIVTLPLLAVAVGTLCSTPLFWVAVAMVVFGIIYEAVADGQLYRFSQNSANKGKVMDKGLWRYSRHPNYFGEFCVWWGFYAMALAFGGWWAILSPLLMTVLLLKVSGVGLMEKTITSSRVGYKAYIKRTNAFFPAKPKS